MMGQDRAFKGEDVVRFLKHAPCQIAGKLLVIWDGSPIHRAKVLKKFLEDEGAARVQLEQLPGYAPELNPDEGIWKHLKLELKNVCYRSLSELRVELRRAKERLRHKRDDILGGIRQPGFVLESRAEINMYRSMVALPSLQRITCCFIVGIFRESSSGFRGTSLLPRGGLVARWKELQRGINLMLVCVVQRDISGSRS